jgi:hypothetical protein
MKQQIEQLIDRLGPGKIYIMHILEYMQESEEYFPLLVTAELINLWNISLAPKYKPLTSSIQEIFDRTEWEEVPCDCHNSGIAPCSLCEQYGSKHQVKLVPKDPAIKALFEFLLQLKTWITT